MDNLRSLLGIRRSMDKLAVWSDEKDGLAILKEWGMIRMLKVYEEECKD